MIGTTIAGRYKIESLLGEGGMASVYLVQHTAIRKRMALKVMRTELLGNADAVARFEREAIAAAQMDHPNVAAASDYGRTEDGVFFLVMELVEGQRLRDVLKAGAMPVSRALLLAYQVTSALVRAHELGIVHRDLKPENIMLTKRGGQEDFVKVLDFGLAKFSFGVPELAAPTSGLSAEAAADGKPAAGAPKLTQAGALFGTPAYLAPEQAFGEESDIRGDLYALGVTLYEMLAGRHPFEGGSLMELIQHQLLTPPPPFKERAPAVVVPAAVEELVLRLMAKKPEARFQTPGELLTVLDGVLAAEGLVGSSPSGTFSGSALARRVDSQRSQPSVSSGSQPALALPSAVKAAMATVRQRLRGLALLARLRQLHARLPARLQKVPLWLFAVLPALGLALPLLWPRSAPETILPTAKPVERSRAPVAAAPKLVPQSQLDGAVAAGPPALEALAAQFPGDARIYRSLVQSYAGQHQLSEALAAMAKLGAVDPNTGRDDAMVHIIVSALQGGSPEQVQAAAVLMERDLGAAGIDLLYDLTVKQTHARWKARLNQSVARPEVRAKATSATQLALDLRAARTCEAKQALLPRAQTEGDQRALVQLKLLLPTRGCGFLGIKDCWPCLRGNNQLQEVINAVTARTSILRAP